MADRLKDDADLKLESLFRSQPVQDDGFFGRGGVTCTPSGFGCGAWQLPVAITIGTLIAAKPLLQLVNAIPKLLMIVPESVGSLNNLPLSSLPQKLDRHFWCDAVICRNDGWQDARRTDSRTRLRQETRFAHISILPGFSTTRVIVTTCGVVYI